jgi:hypothetical protein
MPGATREGDEAVAFGVHSATPEDKGNAVAVARAGGRHTRRRAARAR